MSLEFSTIDKVYTNSLELKEEAEILCMNLRFKRAFFLIYTSLEELEKIIIHIEEKINFLKITNHDSKLKTAQGILEEIRKNLNIEEQKNKLKEILETRDKAFKDRLQEFPNTDKRFLNIGNELVEGLNKELDALFVTENISHFRNGALYISDYSAEKINPYVYFGLYAYFVKAHDDLVGIIKSKLGNSHVLKRIESFDYIKFKAEKQNLKSKKIKSHIP